MDERRDRAWAALGIGPQWRARDVRQSESVEPAVVDVRSFVGVSWTELQAVVSSCTACERAVGRARTVFGTGPVQAPWMLVGEAPGEAEELSGEPVGGAASQLLDQMLAAIGVDRAREAFTANVFKCRTTQEGAQAAMEVAKCLPYLHAQIEAVKPRVILALGPVAAQALLGSELSLAQLRGSIHRYRVGNQDIALIVTFSPADLLGALPDKAGAWADLCLARRCYEAV
jgi:DNA polymerase